MDNLGKGKRKHVPSTAIQEHVQQVTKTKATVEKNRRKAVITQEREEMAREEEEDPIDKELKADEALVARLQRKILKRDPSRKVQYLDLDELKEMWAEFREADTASLRPHPQIQVLGSFTVDSATQPKKPKAKTSAKSQSLGERPSSRPQPKSNADPRCSTNLQTSSSKGKAARAESDAEIEVIRLDDEEGDDTGDNEGGRPPVPSKKAKRVNKGRKPAKDYDEVERRLIDKAYANLILKMLQLGMYVFNPELDEHIEGCWDKARVDLKVDPDKFPCTDQNRETIKTRLNGFRSHVRNQAVSRVPGYYELANIEKQDPKAKSGGRYQHPIINEILCFALATGRNPPASRYPDDFRPLMPLETIAFVCAVIEFVLEQFSLSNLPSRDKFDKMEFGPTRLRWLTHMSSLEAFKEAKPSIMQSIQKRAWTSVAAKLGAALKEPEARPLILENALTIQDFDDECDPDDEESAFPDPAHNAPTPHASSSHRRSASGSKNRAPSPDSEEDVFYTKRSTRPTSPTSPVLNAEPLSESESDRVRPPVRASKSLRGKANKADSESDGEESASSKDSEAEEAARAAAAIPDEPVRARRRIESSDDEVPTNNAARNDPRVSGVTSRRKQTDLGSDDSDSDQAMHKPTVGDEANGRRQGGGQKAAPEPNSSSPDRREDSGAANHNLWPALADKNPGAPASKAKAPAKRKHAASELEGGEPEVADNRRTKSKVTDKDATGGMEAKKSAKGVDKGKAVDRGPDTSPITPRRSSRDRKPSTVALLAAATRR